MKRIVTVAALAITLITVSTAVMAASGVIQLSPGQTQSATCSGRQLTFTRTNATAGTLGCTGPTTTTTVPPTSTTTTVPPTTTTTVPQTTTTTIPSSGGSGPAFVQADDTGTIDGNTTSISSGVSHRVLVNNTGIGHTVVLEIQTLTAPGTQTNTVTSVTSAMGTFQFVNSTNDGADFEIWVCTNTTGASNAITVNTKTNAWDALAVEFNAPATGFTNGGTQNTDPSYLQNQTITVSPGTAGSLVVVGADTEDAYTTYPAAPWTNYNSGYWSDFNGTAAAWQVAPSTAPVTATWQTDGGPSSAQAVVLQY